MHIAKLQMQVISAAEAFRIAHLQARKGSPDEQLMWISGSCSQPTIEAQTVMSGKAHFAQAQAKHNFCSICAKIAVQAMQISDLLLGLASGCRLSLQANCRDGATGSCPGRAACRCSGPINQGRAGAWAGQPAGIGSAPPAVPWCQFEQAARSVCHLGQNNSHSAALRANQAAKSKTLQC